jgi:hypothetical protein
VKVKKSSALKLSGITTRIGAIRKKKIAPQMNLKVLCHSTCPAWRRAFRRGSPSPKSQ